jgi:glycosyltransferase involved in cell wall biosynthesis
MRHGCEDWEFWIHSASKKIWGHTIPEFLMYHRKVHGPGWNKSASQQSLSSLREKIEKHYASAIKKNGFPVSSFENYQFGNIGNLLPVPGEKAQTAYTILCIFPWLKIGGADKFNLDLLKGLKRKGWKIVILTTLGTDHPWQEYFEEVTKEIFHLCNLAPDHKHYLFIDYFIKSRRPGTLFISNSMYGYQMLPYIKRRYPFLFVVDYSHCEEPGWYGGGYPFLSAVYSDFLDKSFVTSKHLQQWMEKKGAALAKTEVCYIGVETGSIIKNTGNRKKIRHQLNLTEAIPLILFVGRLTQQKQPAVLAKSLQLLNEKFNTFQAIIIGDGPDEELLKKIVKKYGLEKRVMFLGGQSNEIVLTYMDAADIFFLPSAYEGIALSIYESMAKALPVVAAHVGGQAELVQPDCGYLIKRSTPDQEALEYSACLEYLCRNPDKSKLMGTVGRKRVENFFSLQSAINQFEAGIEKSSFLEKESTVSFGESRDYLVTINHLRYLELQAQIPTTGMRLLEKLKVLNPLIFRLYGILKRFKR